MPTAQEIRNYLEGLPCPICTKSVSDEEMQKLISEVSDQTKQILGTDHLDFSSEECDDVWYGELEKMAIQDYGMTYYEDMEEAK